MADGTGTGTADDKTGLTDAQLDIIDTRIAGMLNSTLTSRLKGAQKVADDKMTAFMGEITTLVKGIKPATDPATGGDGNGEGSGDGKGKKNRDLDPDRIKLNEVEAKLKEVEARSNAFEKRASDERAKNRNLALRTSVDSGLASVVGIEDPFMRSLAISHLAEQNRFKFEDDDSDDSRVVFLGDDGVLLPLDQGLKGWAKTPEAQKLLPAKGVKGAGTRPRGQAANPTPDQRAEAINGLFGGLADLLR
jgi:hypothetical protein